MIGPLFSHGGAAVGWDPTRFGQAICARCQIPHRPGHECLSSGWPEVVLLCPCHRVGFFIHAWSVFGLAIHYATGNISSRCLRVILSRQASPREADLFFVEG